MVVEDDEINRRVLEVFLARRGVGADFAPDGQSALELLSRGPYGLVLMDVQLPDIPGTEVTRRLRLMPIQQPFVLGVSANTSASDQRGYLDAGMDHVLPKPVKLEQVGSLIVHLSKSIVGTPDESSF